MRFQITMNMPSFTGNPIHQVIVEYPVNDLASFIEELNGSDFLVAEEWYRNAETKEYYYAGEVALNPLFIGKVKVFK